MFQAVLVNSLGIYTYDFSKWPVDNKDYLLISHWPILTALESLLFNFILYCRAPQNSWSVRVAEWLAHPTLDHKVPGSNPTEGGTLLMTV